MKVCQESRNSEGMRSSFQVSGFKSQASGLSSPLSSLFLHLPRGHPVQSPFVSLRANLRFTPDSFHSLPLRRGSEAASRCRASSALKSVPSLAQRAPSSVTLRFAQGKPSVHHLRTVVLRQLSSLSSQVSSLRSQLSLNGPLIPKAAEPAGAHCNRYQHHKKDPAEHLWPAIPVEFASRSACGGLSDNVKAQAMCSAPFAQKP